MIKLIPVAIPGGILVSPAVAADLPSRTEAPAPIFTTIQAYTTWNGAYVGFTVGKVQNAPGATLGGRLATTCSSARWWPASRAISAPA
jgi:hypothetical protein